MEHLSLSTVFGDHLKRMPVSSNKSMIGHTLSAAGAVEAVFSFMTMREGVLPPTINYDNPDPAIDLDVAILSKTRPRPRGGIATLRDTTLADAPRRSWQALQAQAGSPPHGTETRRPRLDQPPKHRP